jgi:hypothetical protein
MVGEWADFEGSVYFCSSLSSWASLSLRSVAEIRDPYVGAGPFLIAAIGAQKKADDVLQGNSMMGAFGVM